MTETDTRTQRCPRPPWHSSMGGRMAIAFCTLSLLVLLTIHLSELYGLPFGLLNGDVSDITSQELTLLAKIADANKKLLSNWLEERRSDAFAVAKTPYLLDLWRSMARSGKSTNPPPALADWFDVVRDAYQYEQVRIIDPVSGKTIAANSNSGKDSPIPSTILADARQPGVEETIAFTAESDTRSARLHIIRQVGQEQTADETPVLLLDLSLDLDAVLKPMLDSSIVGALGRSGEVTVVDNQRRFLTSTRHPLADGTMVVPLSTLNPGKPAQLAVEGGEGNIRAADYRGVQVLAAYRHIPLNPEIAWGMVVKIDEAEALAPISKQRQRAILFLLAGVVFTLICAVIIARRLGRPLRQIAITAANIEAGDLTQRVPLEGTNETIELGRAFNSMVERLKESQEELEKRVIERTAELEALNRELQSEITERIKAEDERLNLERQMLQTQKMESLGVLAGGIAHDFNNILTSIVGNTELALMHLNPESPVLENLKRIEKSAIRASDLAKQMLAYSGKGKFVVEAIDLNRLVEEMGHMLEVSISKKAVLRFNLAKPLPSVEADATQIRQIVMNLVINASEAIGDKSGVIAITTGCMNCDRDYLKKAWLNKDLPEGLYVFLEVADTGCGMDRETQAKIFDPFFTTKFTGRGLGMAAVQGIVRGHKGAINVYSEPGKGSSFKILLPAGAKPVELFNVEPDDARFRGEGTVLLVDDEETVRAIGTEMLKELGFTVITANDGLEAIELFKSHQGLACVILDLTMPHLDGEQTFRELRMLDPHVKVIMSSGYSEFEVTQKFAGKGLTGFIQKPYKMSSLREVIRGISG